MIEIRLLDSIEAMTGLESDWRELAARVAGCRFSQTFDWAVCGWRNGAPAELRCLTAWQDNRLVAVWPFVVRRQGLIRKALPLGSGLNEEYNDPLIDEAVASDSVCAALWAAAGRLADQVELFNLKRAGAMQAIVVAAARQNRQMHLGYESTAYIIGWDGAASWAEVEARRSGKLRYDLRRDAKRLAELGAVRFECAEDEAGLGRAIDWVIAQKRQWLARKHARKDWFFSDRSAGFLKTVGLLRPDAGRLCVFTLSLDDTLIAAAITTVDHNSLEGFVLTSDLSFAKYGPGVQLIEHLSHWCFDHGLVLDMRIMGQTYKERLATRTEAYSGYVVACTALGQLHLTRQWLSQAARRTVRSMLSDAQLAQVKALRKPNKGAG